MSACTNVICCECGEIVHGWPEMPGCCDEVRNYQCGEDESPQCSECDEKMHAEYKREFGSNPETARLMMMNDAELTEVMAEARKLK
jgi:hypothetical protein